MKRVLVDSEDKICYEGIDAKEVLNVLLKHPADVTEENEVKFEDQLRSVKWKGQLRFEVHFDLKFKGIDDWNRPVFKDVDSTLYFGSTEKLYGYNEFMEKGLQYFKDHPDQLEYFGSSFNCEPHGGTQEHFKFNILD